MDTLTVARAIQDSTGAGHPEGPLLRALSEVLIGLGQGVRQLLVRLTWPDLGLFLGLLAIVLYRAPVTSLISRIEELWLQKSGLRARLSQPQNKDAAQQGGTQAPSVSAGAAGRPEPLTPMVQEERDRLAVVLSTSGQDDKEGALRLAARLAILSRFEWAYSVIYGSQLAALQALERLENKRMTREVLERDFYQAAVVKWSFDKDVTFDAWLAFLINQGFVEALADGSIRLMEFGAEFVRFVAKSHPGGWRIY